MKIALIAAMEKEIKLLKPLLENPTEGMVRDYKVYYGAIAGHDVALMQCGIGKVNSAISTLSLIEAFEPDLVINSGVAGGADPSMHVLDLFIATEVAYHDVWCGPGTIYGAAYGFDVILKPDERIVALAETILPKEGRREGLICSGDKFITSCEEISFIKEKFSNALAVDMESASIAQVCTLNKVPFNIIRVISDTPGQEENISQYENFWTEAPERTFQAVEKILSAL